MKCCIAILLFLLGIFGIAVTIVWPTTIWLGGALASATALLAGIGFWLSDRRAC